MHERHANLYEQIAARFEASAGPKINQYTSINTP